MSQENPPSLKIRLFDNHMRICCESEDHLRDICLDNFNRDKVSNGRFEIHNMNLLDDFGNYLRENNYPYAIFRGESNKTVDYWYPVNRSTLSLLADRNVSVTEDEIEILRNYGYVTLEDISEEPRGQDPRHSADTACRLIGLGYLSLVMDTDHSSYKYVNRNEDVLPLYDVSVGDKRSTPVEYVVCSDCVDGEGKTLNKEYRAGEDVRKISPEIGVYQIEGVEGALESGRLLIQVVDSRENFIGERKADVGELAHTIQSGYGLVPFVNVDEGVTPKDVEEIRVFIVSE